jgi:hypothetical protein
MQEVMPLESFKGSEKGEFMSVSGIVNYSYANAYQNVNHITNKKSQNVNGFSNVEIFSAIASQYTDDGDLEKSVASKVDYDEKAFQYVAPNAPDEVKEAWMEAAKETGANGLGMAQNGMLTHISAMMVNRVENWINGIENDGDVLGDSVTSALESAKQALYDLDNPLEPVSKRSLAVQQEIMKERKFYQTFINKNKLETMQEHL